jgi:hypothetical protein
MKCANCNAEFEPRAANQTFCNPRCRKEWNNRRSSRGTVLYDVLMTKRYERNGELSESDLCRLLDTLAADWHQQDLAEGRDRSWGSVVEWLQQNPWVGQFRRTFQC